MEEGRGKKIFQVVSVELVLIILIIIVILATLVYLRVIPTGNLLNLVGLSKDKTVKPIPGQYLAPDGTGQTVPQVTYTTVNPQIDATSDVSGVTVQLKNKEELIRLLQEWKFFGRPYIDSNLESTKGPLSKLTLTLTGVEQPANQVSSPGIGVYLSSNFLVSPGSGKLTVYINPKILADKSKNPDDYFQAEALSTLYRITNPTNSPTERDIRERDLTIILQNLSSRKTSFFTVTTP